MLTLVIGGARSGKSRFAQSLCAAASHVAYIATARSEDAEMRMRIARHQADRPEAWVTIEEPLFLAESVKRYSPTYEALLVDCLTLWLNNLCFQHARSCVEELQQAACLEMNALVSACQNGQVIIVSNEVGQGVVPEHPLARTFRDLQGLVNQQVAEGADFVYQMVAGIALPIKRPKERE